MTKLKNLLKKNDGIITTADANISGISNERLRLFVKEGVLERVAYGVYASRDILPDRMYIFQKQRPKIIYSHETALFLHNLTDRDPINYSVTVPSGYNTKGLKKDGLTVFLIKSNWYKNDIATMKTTFGHKVSVYALERTICDCIRSRNQMDISVVTQALKQYSKRKDKNLNLLMKIATEFKITKILRGYMEVLL
jgi:predicted transcriptional regulator of viral defense system